MTQYFAHSANNDEPPWELLKERLLCVAKRAFDYADASGNEKCNHRITVPPTTGWKNEPDLSGSARKQRFLETIGL